MGRLWGRDVARPKPAGGESRAWSTVHAAETEARRLWGEAWPAAAAVVRDRRLGAAGRARRARLLRAVELLQAMSATSEEVLEALEEAGWGAQDDHAQWGLGADQAVRQLLDAAGSAPTAKDMLEGAHRSDGGAAGGPTVRPALAAALLARCPKASAEPAAFAYLAIAAKLETPCRSGEEWDARRAGWRQAVRRAAASAKPVLAAQRGRRAGPGRRRA